MYVYGEQVKQKVKKNNSGIRFQRSPTSYILALYQSGGQNWQRYNKIYSVNYEYSYILTYLKKKECIPFDIFDLLPNTPYIVKHN